MKALSVVTALLIGLTTSAEARGPFVLLEKGKSGQMQYSLDGQVRSKESFVKAAKTLAKDAGQMQPIILFDRRLSIEEVGAVGGVLSAIGFPLPRYFVFGPSHHGVYEINLNEAVAIFDYAEFIKDPFAAISRNEKK
jgi:hypothetical protein